MCAGIFALLVIVGIAAAIAMAHDARRRDVPEFRGENVDE